MRGVMRRFLSWSRQHGHHLFFAGAILSLGLLISWWTVFITRAVNAEFSLRMRNLELQARMTALELGRQRDWVPATGPFGDDLEITAAEEGKFSLVPLWPDYGVRPQTQAVIRLHDQRHMRWVMVIGEGLTFGVLFLISILMLYQLIRSERASARAMSQLMARMTHEIKTPITGVKALLQTLKTGEIPRHELEPLLDMGLMQLERQYQLAQNMLMGQRLDGGRRALNPTNTCLKSAVNACLEAMGNDRVDVIWTGAWSEGAWVWADPDALRTILDNVLENALKYAEGELRLQLHLEIHGSKINLAVTDDGVGFDARHAEKLFDAYRRLTHELPHTMRGSGMGLTVARRLARSMGGDLTAHSPGKGQGATFTLRLNRARDGFRRGEL